MTIKLIGAAAIIISSWVAGIMFFNEKRIQAGRLGGI